MMPSMPSGFPEHNFREFRKSAGALFPTFDQKEDCPEREHFVRASQAVGFRYRTCAEGTAEFSRLLSNAPDIWRVCNSDPDHAYKLERVLFEFFMNALSVFESLSFCLYFVGHAIQPHHFQLVADPKKITLEKAAKAFKTGFPAASVSALLFILPQESEFKRIDGLRNILAHRLCGMRSMRGQSTRHANGTFTHTSEDVWYVPGAPALTFDAGLTQTAMDSITRLLAGLVSVALDFAKANQPVAATP